MACCWDCDVGVVTPVVGANGAGAGGLVAQPTNSAAAGPRINEATILKLELVVSLIGNDVRMICFPDRCTFVKDESLVLFIRFFDRP
jgi:hypothetical protein